jgi:dihydroorotase
VKIIIKQGLVIDEDSPYHNQRVDIFLENGVISEVKKRIDRKGIKVIKEKNLHVSPGWLDIGAFNGEPGLEHRETLHSLKESAACGGYAYLAPFPNTSPVTDSKTQVEFLARSNHSHAVEILPIGAITKGANGDEVSEIKDLLAAGVVAFSDGHNSQLAWAQLVRSLEYLRGSGAKVIMPALQYPKFTQGQIHEGKISVSLGMVGMPDIEEEHSFSEIVRASRYTSCPVHLHNISCSGSVRMLKKEADEMISASVAYLNLLFTDEEMRHFNRYLKVIPPLREESDRKALIKAIVKGRVNTINTNHFPLSLEESDVEFGHAPFGSIGLETCFRAILSHVPEIPLERLIYCLSKGPYDALGLDRPTIDSGNQAALTLFSTSSESVFENNGRKLHLN